MSTCRVIETKTTTTCYVVEGATTEDEAIELHKQGNSNLEWFDEISETTPQPEVRLTGDWLQPQKQYENNKQ